MLFDRTFHHDEATQAFTTGRLLETGCYAYQPQDHHGPTLYYAAAAIQKAAGHNDTASLDGTLLRCTPLVFAVLALVFGFAALKRLTKSVIPGLVFALLLGTSPFFAFFATDFIQEVLLTCFLLMMFWAGTGYLHPGKKWKTGTWALFFGTATALAFATKETCLISFFAAGLAAAPFLVKHVTKDKLRARARDAVLAVLGFLIVSFVLYSDFGRDFHGVYNAFIAAPLSYLRRAVGNAATSVGADWHVHPWWQYFHWLHIRTPGLLPLFSLAALTALVTCRHATTTTSRAFRFTLAYALVTFAVYSLIPYKTPWCTVQLESALVLASVLGLASMADTRPACKWLLVILPAILLAGGNLPTLVQMNRAPDDTGNPCNYAAASPELKDLAATVTEALQFATNHEPAVIVALPNADEIGLSSFRWYTRDLERGKRIGYCNGLEDLVYLQNLGFCPTVLIIPENMDRLVQPLFPHLREKKLFYMRPPVPERNVRGVRVCALCATGTPGETGGTCGEADASPEVKELAATVADAIKSATGEGQNATTPFIAVGMPAADISPFPLYNKSHEDITGYWNGLDDLAKLQAAGFKPTVVIVPMEEGHLVQPIFPHLKHTKRFYVRPRIPERKVRGMRVRVFW